MINTKLRGFFFIILHIREKNTIKRQELNFFWEITSQQRLHTCLTPVAVLRLIWISYKCHEYLNFYTAQAYFRQKEWFSSITVCCRHVDSGETGSGTALGWQGVSKVLSSFPSHSLTAGGHILDPSVFHKTKAKAVETRTGWLPGWEVLHWIHKDDFGKKILGLLCHSPSGVSLLWRVLYCSPTMCRK